MDWHLFSVNKIISFLIIFLSENQCVNGIVENTCDGPLVVPFHAFFFSCENNKNWMVLVCMITGLEENLAQKLVCVFTHTHTEEMVFLLQLWMTQHILHHTAAAANRHHQEQK